MRIALVDDENVQLQNIQAMLSTALHTLGIEVRQLDCFSSGESFLSAWQPGSYDVILLDIYMDTHNGVTIARQIRQEDSEVVLAFCTSSNEFASESYEVGAGYYLQKPVSEEKITAMLRRLDLSRIERNRTIVLPDGYRCLLRKIVYTEYSNHSVVFHIKDEKSHSVYMNHSEAEKRLLHYRQFCCINKGCIVNLAMVRKAADSTFLMQNGEALPIARRRYKEVFEAYTRFRFEQMDQEVME